MKRDIFGAIRWCSILLNASHCLSNASALRVWARWAKAWRYKVSERWVWLDKNISSWREYERCRLMRTAVQCKILTDTWLRRNMSDFYIFWQRNKIHADNSNYQLKLTQNYACSTGTNTVILSLYLILRVTPSLTAVPSPIVTSICPYLAL